MAILRLRWVWVGVVSYCPMGHFEDGIASNSFTLAAISSLRNGRGSIPLQTKVTYIHTCALFSTAHDFRAFNDFLFIQKTF